MAAERGFDYRIFAYGLILGIALGASLLYIVMHQAATARGAAAVDNVTAVYITYLNSATGHLYSTKPLLGFSTAIGSVYNYSFTINYYNGTYNETISSISAPVNGNIKIYGVYPKLPITIQRLSNATITLLLLMPNSTYKGPLNLTVMYHKDVN